MNVTISEIERTVRWRHEGRFIVKEFSSPPRSAIYWGDPPSVIVVAPLEENSYENAIVFESNGKERTRIQPPKVAPEESWNIGFDVVFADSEGLVAVFSTSVGDFWGRPNLLSGELSSVATWR